MKIYAYSNDQDPIEGAVSPDFNLDTLVDELKDAAYQFFLDEGFPEEPEDKWDISISDMMPIIDTEERSEGYYIELRGEYTYATMDKLLSALDPVISEYDPDAYFEIDQPGIATAYLYKAIS